MIRNETGHLLEREPYKSIIAMLRCFPHKGLEQKHLRYELGKETKKKSDNGNIFCYRAGLKTKQDNGTLLRSASRIEEFLQKKRAFYIENVKQNNNKIKNSKILTEQLNRLIDYDLINKDKGRYYLNKHAYKKGFIEENINHLDCYRLDEIKENLIPGIDKFFTRCVTFGFSDELLSSLNEETKKELYTNLQNIFNHYQEIQDIKLDEIDKQWKKILKTYLKKTKSPRIKKIINDDIRDNMYLFGQLFSLFFDALFYCDKEWEQNICYFVLNDFIDIIIKKLKESNDDDYFLPCSLLTEYRFNLSDSDFEEIRTHIDPKYFLEKKNITKDLKDIAEIILIGLNEMEFLIKYVGHLDVSISLYGSIEKPLLINLKLKKTV